MSTNLIQEIATVVVTLLGVFGLNAHSRKQIMNFLKSGGTTLIKDGETVIQNLANDVHLPAFTAVEASLKHEVDALTAQLHASNLGKLALAGLHAFNLQLDSLSATQKIAITNTLQKSFPSLTTAEIDTTLAEVQKLASDLSGSSLFTSANTFTQAQAQGVTPSAQ